MEQRKKKERYGDRMPAHVKCVHLCTLSCDCVCASDWVSLPLFAVRIKQDGSDTCTFSGLTQCQTLRHTRRGEC